MNKKTVTIIIAVLLLIIATLGYLLSRANDASNSWQSSFEASAESARFWHNKEGLSQGEKKTAYAAIDVINAQHSAELDKAHQEISGLKKNNKNLQSLISISSETTGKIEAVLKYSTITTPGQLPQTVKSFAYSDKWSIIDGYFLRDSVQVKYKFYDSLRIVQYWNRDGLFKPKSLYTSVVSENPNTTLTGIKATTVRPPTSSRFGVVVFAGTTYPFQPVIGIGLGYTLIQF